MFGHWLEQGPARTPVTALARCGVHSRQEKLHDTVRVDMQVRCLAPREPIAGAVTPGHVWWEHSVLQRVRTIHPRPPEPIPREGQPACALRVAAWCSGHTPERMQEQVVATRCAPDERILRAAMSMSPRVRMIGGSVCKQQQNRERQRERERVRTLTLSSLHSPLPPPSPRQTQAS
jgi:hypothetical protein